MPIDILTCKPERLEDVAEVDDLLKRMDMYKEECAKNSSGIGVLKIQSRQLGAIYVIESMEKAEEEINNPRTVEWGLKFYQRAYFEELREKLQKESNYRIA